LDSLYEVVGVFAVSTTWAVLYGIALWLLVLTPAVITALKGQWILFGAGFVLLGMVWVIAAFRLARPNSVWARRFYGPDKLARARARYPKPVPG
jgi:hypothetical protein